MQNKLICVVRAEPVRASRAGLVAGCWLCTGIPGGAA
jgi:hypothetical protein